jgi:hypothetical protein
MKTNPTSRAEEPAGAQSECRPNPSGRIHVLDEELVNHPALHTPLPCRADRQRIVEQAERVLSEAQALAEQWDLSFRPPITANRLPGIF